MLNKKKFKKVKGNRMKAIWQGILSFGLVNIPVGLFTAVKSHAIGFTLLCAQCNTPIHYKRWCEHCQKEVEWNAVVKGLKLKNGEYFVLTQENIRKLKPAKTDFLQILEFISPALIDPIYLDHHYYVAPIKNGERAYFLFVQALRATQKIAFGKFVMRDKENIFIIYPYDDGLVLTTLNYEYEIQDMNVLKGFDSIPTISQQEINLAVRLIELGTKTKLDLSQYKDEFAQKLLVLIQKKRGKKLLPPPKVIKATKSNTLLSDLEKSLKVHTKKRSLTR